MHFSTLIFACCALKISVKEAGILVTDSTTKFAEL
jgi:hypothetical protein